MAAAPAPNPEEVRRLYEFMLREGLYELHLKDSRPGHEKEIRLRRRRASAPAPAAAPAAAVSAPPVETVSSPLAGIFYRSPRPGARPFAEAGQVVNRGQTLCLVEAMKMFNEIKAARPGRILRFLVENGRPVSAGAALLELEPL